jgi:hypothetical protein
LRDLSIREVGCFPPGHHHQVAGWMYVRFIVPEKLADTPFEAIAHHGPTHPL